MPREVESSITERQFFTKALQENIRLDGRLFDQFRPLELEFGDEYGVADVGLGKTRYNFSYHVIQPNRELTSNQSNRPNLRRSHSSLPRSTIRRPLHYHHRTQPYGLSPIQ